MSAQSKDTTIVIGVSNQILGSKTNSKDQTRNIILQNNIKAQYSLDGTLQMGTRYLKAAFLTWNDKEKEYIIAYSSNETSKDQKQALLQIANQMQK